MAKELKTRTNPIIAYVITWRAPCVCLGSPPDITNFIPPQIIKKTATDPTNMRAALTILPNTTGIQLSEATLFLSTQLPQADAWTGSGMTNRNKNNKNSERGSSFFIIVYNLA